jgi:hypothetical protein
MRKTLLTTAAAVAGMLLVATSALADPSVVGIIKQTHSGTLRTCMKVNGQWYGVENIYNGQVVKLLLAASDGATISFELYDPPQVVQCKGTQPAFLVHDLDRDY